MSAKAATSEGVTTPVRLRHLGGQRDEAGGEHHLAGGGPEQRALAVEQEMAGHRAEERPERTAGGEPDTGAAELAPHALVPDALAHTGLRISVGR